MVVEGLKSQIDLIIAEIQVFARNRTARLVAVSIRVPPGLIEEGAENALAHSLTALSGDTVTVRAAPGGERLELVSVEFRRPQPSPHEPHRR